MSVTRAAQLVDAGLWLRLSGDHDGAKRLFEQALKLDPENARARQLVEGGGSAPELQPQPPPEVPPVSALSPFQRPPTAVSPMEEDWGLATGPLSGPSSAPVEGLTRDATSAWDSQANPGMHLSDPGLSAGSAMDLVAADPRPAIGVSAAVDSPARPNVQDEIQTLLQGAKEMLELDDHSGAMDLISKAQALSPHDPEVSKLREKSEKILQANFESKLGPLEKKPKVAIKEDEIIWLNLDHRAGFVLAQIDGTVTFEDLFAVSGMSRLDTARILAQLVDEGVIR